MKSPFQSKLPNLGTSIFTEMSMMANEYNAINLSQGFPEFDTPDLLKSEINSAISNGKNQIKYRWKSNVEGFNMQLDVKINGNIPHYGGYR